MHILLVKTCIHKTCVWIRVLHGMFLSDTRLLDKTSFCYIRERAVTMIKRVKEMRNAAHSIHSLFITCKEKKNKLPKMVCWAGCPWHVFHDDCAKTHSSKIKMTGSGNIVSAWIFCIYLIGLRKNIIHLYQYLSLSNEELQNIRRVYLQLDGNFAIICQINRMAIFSPNPTLLSFLRCLDKNGFCESIPYRNVEDCPRTKLALILSSHASTGVSRIFISSIEVIYQESCLFNIAAVIDRMSWKDYPYLIFIMYVSCYSCKRSNACDMHSIENAVWSGNERSNYYPAATCNVYYQIKV